MMIALDAGAEDFKAEDDSFEITAAPEDFDAISQALEENNIETVESEITMIPDTTVKVEGKDAEKMQTLIDSLKNMMMFKTFIPTTKWTKNKINL